MERIGDHTNRYGEELQKKRAVQKKRLQREEARYTLILHAARKKLDISITEYCFVDTIHKLSSNRSAVPGWCFASKEHLANILGLTRQGIHKMIKRLKETEKGAKVEGKGLIEEQEETGYLRTTEEWRQTVEVMKDQAFK